MIQFLITWVINILHGINVYQEGHTGGVPIKPVQIVQVRVVFQRKFDYIIARITLNSKEEELKTYFSVHMENAKKCLLQLINPSIFRISIKTTS